MTRFFASIKKSTAIPTLSPNISLSGCKIRTKQWHIFVTFLSERIEEKRQVHFLRQCNEGVRQRICNAYRQTIFYFLTFFYRFAIFMIVRYLFFHFFENLALYKSVPYISVFSFFAFCCELQWRFSFLGFNRHKLLES